MVQSIFFVVVPRKVDDAKHFFTIQVFSKHITFQTQDPYLFHTTDDRVKVYSYSYSTVLEFMIVGLYHI